MATSVQASFEEWKRAKGLHQSQPRTAAAPLTSRVSTQKEREEALPSNGAYSFSQMQRLEARARYQPPSEIGSVRSVRSVMTVEEQVSNMERRLEEVLEEQKATRKRDQETQKMLKAIWDKISTDKR